MFRRVRERFLHDAVHRQLQRGRQPNSADVEVHPHRHSACLRSGDELRDIGDGRIGFSRVRRSLAHQAQQCAQFSDGLLPCRPHGDQCPAGSFRVGGDHLLGGTRLEHHHAQSVGDDVVEFTCDPSPFRLGRCRRARFLVLLQPRGTIVEPIGANVQSAALHAREEREQCQGR